MAGFTGFTDEHDEKVETMTSGVDHAVGSGSDQVAEGGEGLEEDGGGVSLGVWLPNWTETATVLRKKDVDGG